MKYLLQTILFPLTLVIALFTIYLTLNEQSKLDKTIIQAVDHLHTIDSLHTIAIISQVQLNQKQDSINTYQQQINDLLLHNLNH